MPTFTLGANENVRIKFPVPRDHLIKFAVEAERAIDVWILDREGLRQFDDVEEKIDNYYGKLRQTKHQDEIELPFRGSWWLLIVNRNDEPVAVHYDVFW